VLKGSCACGKIHYQITGSLIGPITYCHCWRCRKHSGSSFGTTAGLKADQFSITRGEELLSSWQSSPGIHRYFASCCGSPIYKSEESEPQTYGFRLGTLDVDPNVVVSQHYMIDSTAPWVEICDSLDQIEGGDGPFPSHSNTTPNQ